MLELEIGEAMRFMGQFKAFPIAMYVNKVLGREVAYFKKWTKCY